MSDDDAFGEDPDDTDYEPIEADYVAEAVPSSERRTDAGAVWALVVALLSYVLLPLVGSVVALFLAAGAQHRIDASYGALGGAGLVTAAKILAWVHLVLLAIGAVILILVLVVANGSTETLDLDRAEQEITESLQTEYVGFQVDRVTCPDDVEVEAGAQFTCTTEIDGQPLDIVVTQENDEGRVTFAKAQAAIPVETAEEFIVEEFRKQGTSVLVDCGDQEVIVTDPGATIECAVATEDGDTTSAVVTVTDVQGNVTIDFGVGE